MNATQCCQPKDKKICRGRYPKGLRDQNGEHLCESNNFDETQV